MDGQKSARRRPEERKRRAHCFSIVESELLKESLKKEISLQRDLWDAGANAIGYEAQIVFHTQ